MDIKFTDAFLKIIISLFKGEINFLRKVEGSVSRICWMTVQHSSDIIQDTVALLTEQIHYKLCSAMNSKLSYGFLGKIKKGIFISLSQT